MRLRNFAVSMFLPLHACLASAGTLAGDSIDVSINRTVDTGYGVGRIYGYGLDGPFTVLDGDTDKKQYSSTFTIDVDGDGFKIQFLTWAGWQEGIVLTLSDLNFLPNSDYEISRLAISSNLSGYSFSSGASSINIGLGGTQFLPSTYFSVQFDTTPVPEPATAAMYILALLSLCLLRMNRMVALGGWCPTHCCTGLAPGYRAKPVISNVRPYEKPPQVASPLGRGWYDIRQSDDESTA